MDDHDVLEAIRAFVEHFAAIPDVQYAAVPWPLHSHEGIAYLLMVASINQQASAESIRELVRTICHSMRDDNILRYHTFPVERRDAYLTRLHGSKTVQRLGLSRWPLWERDPVTRTYRVDRILASAAAFIEAEASAPGGLTTYGQRSRTVEQAAARIAQSIEHMGRSRSSARKKVWMFMRWMVRPAPDIGVWKGALNPADLRVPLDVNTGRAFQEAVCQEWCKMVSQASGSSETVASVQRHRTGANSCPRYETPPTSSCCAS
nr:MAG: hypothetical protein DIU80_08205 [Chloroflexota bacterium]